jgi:hypothetical protein
LPFLPQRKTGPIVTKKDKQLLAVRHRRNSNPAFRWRVLRGVLEKIDEELFQENTVSINEWKIAWNVCCDYSATQ